jgi:hypothetical protein
MPVKKKPGAAYAPGLYNETRKNSRNINRQI